MTIVRCCYAVVSLVLLVSTLTSAAREEERSSFATTCTTDQIQTSVGHKFTKKIKKSTAPNDEELEVIDLTDDSNHDVNQVHEQVPPEAARAPPPPPPEVIEFMDTSDSREVSLPNRRNRPRVAFKAARGSRRDRRRPNFYEPPLPEGQLEANEHHIQQLPTHRISDDDTLPEHARQCAICFEEITKGALRMILPCFHGFHTDCCTQWLRINGSCPICKQKIG